MSTLVLYRIARTRAGLPHDTSRPFLVFRKDRHGEVCIGRYTNESGARRRINDAIKLNRLDQEGTCNSSTSE